MPDTKLFPELDAKYRHHKGKIYTVVGFGKMKASKETVVIYRQWGDRRNPVWVRPLSEWWEKFERVDA